MNNPGKASLPVIKRLPKYYRYLRTLKNDGITSISSRELAAQMGTKMCIRDRHRPPPFAARRIVGARLPGSP